MFKFQMSSPARLAAMFRLRCAQKGIGLKLEKTTLPLDGLAIKRLERRPAED
jgi:hypothetical protein